MSTEADKSKEAQVALAEQMTMLDEMLRVLRMNEANLDIEFISWLVADIDTAIRDGYCWKPRIAKELEGTK
jgi:hypothetical protein